MVDESEFDKIWDKFSVCNDLAQLENLCAHFLLKKGYTLSDNASEYHPDGTIKNKQTEFIKSIEKLSNITDKTVFHNSMIFDIVNLNVTIGVSYDELGETGGNIPNNIREELSAEISKMISKEISQGKIKINTAIDIPKDQKLVNIQLPILIERTLNK